MALELRTPFTIISLNILKFFLKLLLTYLPLHRQVKIIHSPRYQILPVLWIRSQRHLFRKNLKRKVCHYIEYALSIDVHIVPLILPPSFLQLLTSPPRSRCKDSSTHCPAGLCISCTLPFSTFGSPFDPSYRFCPRSSPSKPSFRKTPPAKTTAPLQWN